MAAARVSHDAAGAILTAHAGFNDKGEATDKPAARKTLEDARAKMKDAHAHLITGAKAVRDAAKGFRKDAKPKA